MPEPGSAQPYSMRELQRLAEAPLRRPWVVLVPLVLVLVGAVGVSFLLPPRYSSSTLILVAPEQMPANFMPQMTTEKVTRRLQTLRQEVQSRTRLETVARELDPYGTLGKEPLINTIERMRVGGDRVGEGQRRVPIEFEHREPKMAMLVADRLTTLFMEEVAGARERQVSEAYQFIDTQMQDARASGSRRRRRHSASSRSGTWASSPSRCRRTSPPSSACSSSSRSVAESLRRATDALLLLESSGSSPVAAPGAPTRPTRSPSCGRSSRSCGRGTPTSTRT